MEARAANNQHTERWRSCPEAMRNRAGVEFSINSDDPLYSGNHYILEKRVVQAAFDLGAKEQEYFCETNIRGSWCSKQTRYEFPVKTLHAIERHGTGG